MDKRTVWYNILEWFKRIIRMLQGVFFLLILWHLCLTGRASFNHSIVHIPDKSTFILNYYVLSARALKRLIWCHICYTGKWNCNAFCEVLWSLTSHCWCFVIWLNCSLILLITQHWTDASVWLCRAWRRPSTCPLSWCLLYYSSQSSLSASVKSDANGHRDQKRSVETDPFHLYLCLSIYIPLLLSHQTPAVVCVSKLCYCMWVESFPCL